MLLLDDDAIRRLAALQLLDAAPSSTANLLARDVLAIGLWSALSFQKPRSERRLEALRVGLLQKAREAGGAVWAGVSPS